MDRYLASGVLGLLIFQVLFLLNDLGLVEVFSFSKVANQSDREVIGKLIEKRSSVKRKAVDSIIWEDQQKSDLLYKMDSVLTLDHSTAKLSLQGDINLLIHENTLVVLEPLDEADESLRVRFHRGQLNSRNRQRYSISTGYWSFTASSGTELALRSLSNDRVELEVSDGQVHLINKETGQAESLSEGKSFILGKSQLEEQRQIVSDISFQRETPGRIYSHGFPVAVPVSWTGEVSKLRILHPNKREEVFEVGQSSALLGLQPGTYVLSLENSQNGSSKGKVLQVIPAPKLRYLYPLPRDRIAFGAKQLFSWLPLAEAKNYEVLFVGKTDTVRAESDRSSLDYLAEKSGEFNWSVLSYDEDGYEIPPYYSLPVYFTPQPLPAPILNVPMKDLEQRLPASEKKSDDSASLPIRMLEKITSLLIPSAWANTAKAAPPIVFTWQPVPGADHYVIEISHNPDFLKPDVITKVTTTKYLWPNYKKQMYYWRVAGGTSDGRMGLFSPVQSFDVAKLSFDNSGSVPYIQKVPTKRNVEVTKKAEANQAPDAAENRKPETAPTITRLSIGGSYWSLGQKSQDITSVSFQGFSVPSFSLMQSWSVFEKTVFTQVNYHRLQWKPKDDDKLPYQDEFTTEVIALKMHTDGWGLVISQFPVMERKALEEIEPNSTYTFGILLRWEKSIGKHWEWESDISVAFGEGLHQPSWANSFHYKLKEKSFLQLDLDVVSLSGGNNDINSLWFRTGIGYAYQW